MHVVGLFEAFPKRKSGKRGREVFEGLVVVRAKVETFEGEGEFEYLVVETTKKAKSGKRRRERS